MQIGRETGGGSRAEARTLASGVGKTSDSPRARTRRCGRAARAYQDRGSGAWVLSSPEGNRNDCRRAWAHIDGHGATDYRG